MKYLVIQDDEKVLQVIQTSITKNDLNASCSFAKNYGEAIWQLNKNKFDFIIFDIYLPANNSGSDVIKVGADLLNYYLQSSNINAPSMLITKDKFGSELAQVYNQNGIIVVSYSENLNMIQQALEFQINKLINEPKFDFIIFCALLEEANAYQNNNCEISEMKTIRGINLFEISYNGKKGICVVPFKPGPIDMAIVVTKAIEYFRPKIVTMSGICAGIKGESNILDVLITDPSWNYQYGKCKDEKFLHEIIQTPINTTLKTTIIKYINNNATKLVTDYISSKGLNINNIPEVKLVSTATGASVVADHNKVEEMKIPNRKIAGFDMEVDSFYKASEQSSCKPLFFSVKSVVDLGDTNKSDEWHDIACELSSNVTLNLLQYVFMNNS